MGVVSRRWMWVECMGVVLRRYIDFLILLIPTLVSALFLQQHPYFLFIFLIPTFCSFFFLMFFVLVYINDNNNSC